MLRPGRPLRRRAKPSVPTGNVPRVRSEARVRWGVPDAVAAWFAGLVAALVVGSAFGERMAAVELALLLVVQGGAIVAWLALVARRKGLGTLAADFGLLAVGVGSRWRAETRWLFAGFGLQLAWIPLLLVLQEVHGELARQEAVRVASRASGLEVPLIVLAVGVVAPVAEELLYRGALLRCVLRRTTPGWSVLVTSLVFAAVHFGDPSVGTVMAFPAIFSLGLVAGYQTAKTGDLVRAVYLHVGFNLVSVIAILTDVT